MGRHGGPNRRPQRFLQPALASWWAHTVPHLFAEREALSLHPGPASRGICLSLVRGEATDYRPEARRWMICSGRSIAVDYYGQAYVASLTVQWYSLDAHGESVPGTDAPILVNITPPRTCSVTLPSYSQIVMVNH